MIRLIASNRTFLISHNRLAAFLLSACILTCIGGNVRAQQAPTSAPTSAPAPIPQGITIVQPEGKLLLNFRDASIDTILDELARAAKLTVIKNVQTQGRIPALVNLSGVTTPQAVALIDSALAQLDYAAVLQGDIVRVGRVSDFKRTIVPVVQITDTDSPDKLDDTDRLITVVIGLRYASATQLRQDLTPLINPTADFTANASSNSLMMTDSEVNIKRIVKIVKALDSQVSSQSEVKILKLQYANAQDVARLINDLFRQPTPPAQPGANTNAGNNPGPGRRGPNGAAPGNFGNFGRGARGAGGGF